MAGDVHTTYFAALDHEKVEPRGCVYGVVRQPHDWVEELVDKNLQTLGPPQDLLEAAKRVEAAAEDADASEPMADAWEQVSFADRYQTHLQQPGARQVVQAVRSDLASGDVWLVCYEKDPSYCHRRLLAAHLLEGRDQDPVHHPAPSECSESNSRNGRLSDYQQGEELAQ